MTGYGAGDVQNEAANVSVEARSVNHRFLDLHVRVPREYASLEVAIQQAVRARLTRGRVDVSVSIQSNRPVEILINRDLARSYVETATRISEEFKLQEHLDLRTLLTLPGVMQGKETTLSDVDGANENVARAVLECLTRALDGLSNMRDQEGKALHADMTQHLKSIEEKTQQVRLEAPKVPEEYRQRLHERLARVLPQNGLDPQRLAQEVALIAEKSDVSEELARLESHLQQFQSWLDSNAETGKKLDFLLQEMQREINTILSKSSNLEITRSGIAIKSDIEKLREQVQNVE